MEEERETFARSRCHDGRTQAAGCTTWQFRPVIKREALPGLPTSEHPRKHIYIFIMDIY